MGQVGSPAKRQVRCRRLPWRVAESFSGKLRRQRNRRGQDAVCVEMAEHEVNRRLPDASKAPLSPARHLITNMIEAFLYPVLIIGGIGLAGC